MSRLAVISDSHGAAYRLQQFERLAKKRNYDAITFCGDGLSDVRPLARSLEAPIYKVAGNCDFDGRTPREVWVTLDGVKILIVHGHLFESIRWDLSSLSYYAEQKGAQLVLYGHTHRPAVDWMGSVLLVNPGALKDGRYAEIEIEGGQILPRLMEL